MSGLRRGRGGGFPAARQRNKAASGPADPGAASRLADARAGFDVEPDADGHEGQDRADQPVAHEPPTMPDPRRKALELLTRREHSRQELVRKLVQRGIDEASAEAAVDDMAERGWQDDERFAHSLARSRANAGHGPLRIRAELRLHDLDEAAIDSALEACETDWNQSALDLLRRRYPGPPRDRNDKAKRGGFLQRRGFDLDAIHAALRATEADADTDDC